MVTSVQGAPAVQGTPPAAQAVGVGVVRRRGWLPPLIILGVILLVIAGVYIFAWIDANNLTNQYLTDADASYAKGKYLDSLVGYSEFDPATNQNVQRGGYMQVESIWNNSWAWPRPAGADRAQQRINEVINQKMTIQQAEQFVQENTGKPNAYFGVIYLRLGELYEQAGRTSDAKDVYQTVIDSFSQDPDLVNSAKQHLAKLGGK